MLDAVLAEGGWLRWLRNRLWPEHQTDQVPSPADFQDRVRLRAYRLWEQGGHLPNRDDEYWRTAEQQERATAGQSLTGDIERLQFQSDLAEVQLMLDFISGRPDKALSQVTPGSTTTTTTTKSDGSEQTTQTVNAANGIAASNVTDAELQRIAAIRFPPPANREAEKAADAALLLSVRDRLNRAIYPASGLTIAFTLRTWTPWLFSARRLNADWARWRLANQAYPRLGRSILYFRISSILLSFLAVVITVATVWASNVVADAQAQVARIKALDTQETTNLALLTQLANVPSPAPGPAGPQPTAASAAGRLAMAGGLAQQVANDSMASPSVVPRPGATARVVRYCDRSRLLEHDAATGVQLFDDAQEYQACDQFGRLQKQAAVAVTDLQQAWSDWQKSPFVVVGCRLARVVGGHSSACTVQPDLYGPLVVQSPDGSVDLFPLEFPLMADMVADLSNIWLPVAYGMIGSIVAALRSIYTKISTSTLAPWDSRLMWTRVLLGSMAGGCIGLFFSPAGTAVGGSTGIGSLSLSAVAFLAGYTVDGLFAMLDEVVRRIFRMDAEAPRPAR